MNSIRAAFRTLWKNPGFTTVAVLTLGVGIGVNTAVFAITSAVLFRGFPHVDPDNRILYINRAGCCEISYPDFEDWKAQAKSFDGMAAVDTGGLRLILDDASGGSETCDGTRLTSNAFEVLRVRPVIGRDFAASDGTPGARAVAILNYAFWQRRYAKDTSIVGQTIWLNGTPTTVIGVMPPDFYFPHRRVDLWVPIVPSAALQRRDHRVLWFAFGRVAHGVTRRKAQAEMDAIGRRLESAYPLTNRGIRPQVWNFQEFFTGPGRAAFYGAMWGAVGFVLLIACANLANLLLARAIGRYREISIRLALGAGGARIIRGVLLESTALASLGGVLGWWIALGSVRLYEALAQFPSSYDHWDFALDYRVFFYLVAISTLAGLLFGLAPALRLARIDLTAALKAGGHGASAGGRRKALSSLLIASEMALAIILLCGAGLMIRSFMKVYDADLGVRTQNILTASVDLPAARYPSVQLQSAFFENLQARLETVAGVDSVTLSNSLPGLYAPRLAFEIAGAPVPEDRRPAVSQVVIGDNYFRTLGARVLSGREFNRFDAATGVPVAIVNERLASRFWPGENPLGKRLHFLETKTEAKTAAEWRTVVGVASNIVQNDNTRQAFEPVVYVPYSQKPGPFLIALARTRIPPASLASAFRREIQALDSELVIGSGQGSLEGPEPLANTLAFNNWSHGVNAALFFVFAAISVLLAAVGLYAVTAHAVSQRTQEIGIRMAIGAHARDIRRLVLRQGMLPLVAGLALGITGSLGVNRILKSELVQVSPADPVTFLIAVGVLTLAAALGCWIPARRAMRVDPVVALRHG